MPPMKPVKFPPFLTDEEMDLRKRYEKLRKLKHMLENPKPESYYLSEHSQKRKLPFDYAKSKAKEVAKELVLSGKVTITVKEGDGTKEVPRSFKRSSKLTSSSKVAKYSSSARVPEPITEESLEWD